MSYQGTRIGDMTLCEICGKAIQLRRCDIDDYWAHFALSNHKAIPKRCWSDYDCYGNPT